MDYIYSFVITGCIGVIQKWLEDDMEKSTRSMAEMLMILQLTFKPYMYKYFITLCM